ncbi:hypothetical protein M419DRAFT_122103, partial [Trichoderma reesei RUT C-30]
MPPASATWLTKLKVQLKLAIARLRMVQQRDEQLGKTQRRAMAQLLEAGKVDSATIRVENIIRADITSELHELLELYCELLLARAGLRGWRRPSRRPSGKEFVLAAMENADGKVNEKVVKKLSVEAPRKELVQGYLEEIAKAYGVDWPKRERVMSSPPPPDLIDGDDLEDDKDGGDHSGGGGGGGGQAHKNGSNRALTAAERKLSLSEQQMDRATPPSAKLGEPKSPLMVTPPRMTTDNVHPKVMMGSVELKSKKDDVEETRKKKAEPEGSIPDIGD